MASSLKFRRFDDAGETAPARAAAHDALAESKWLEDPCSQHKRWLLNHSVSLRFSCIREAGRVSDV